MTFRLALRFESYGKVGLGRKGCHTARYPSRRHRQLTIMFRDLVGSTELSGKWN